LENNADQTPAKRTSAEDALKKTAEKAVTHLLLKLKMGQN